MEEQDSQKEYINENDRLLENILDTTMRYEKDQALANDVKDYIIRIFNSQSFEGVYDFPKYEATMDTMIDGLFELIYIKHYTKKLEDRDSVYASSSNLCAILLTRIYKGMHYKKGLAKTQVQGALVGIKQMLAAKSVGAGG